MSEPILAVVEDLIFLSKILDTAHQLGVALETVHPEKLKARATELGVHTAIIDLNHSSGKAIEALAALKADPATSHVRTLGFVSHVQAELIRAARAAGCDRVVARSAFSQQLPEWLAQLAGQ